MPSPGEHPVLESPSPQGDVKTLEGSARFPTGPAEPRDPWFPGLASNPKDGGGHRTMRDVKALELLSCGRFGPGSP